MGWLFFLVLFGFWACWEGRREGGGVRGSGAGLIQKGVQGGSVWAFGMSELVNM